MAHSQHLYKGVREFKGEKRQSKQSFTLFPLSKVTAYTGGMYHRKYRKAAL